MTNKWNYLPLTSEQELISETLEEKYPQCPTICKLLAQRGVTSVAETEKFFKPLMSDLHDPFLMKDMHKAVNRLNAAIGAKEKIMIYGDYDVDGTTAVALVYRYLLNYYSGIDYYVPDRYEEGYGISTKSINYAAENGISLIITLDCGIKAVERIAYARTKGIEFIICDHHVPDAQLPDATAILNPKLEDEPYPYKHLSGCGVGYKFMQGFAISNGLDIACDLEPLLDLVAVSIVSDIVPITGENRILTYHGLRRLNSNPSVGLRAIIRVCQLQNKKNINISDIIFKIGINSSGGNVNELYNLLALIDIAKQKNIKIKTVVTSDAFSCASLLAIHGDERLIYKFGTHLLHLGCVSTSVCTFTQLKRNEKFIKEHFENIVKMYVENTKIPEEKVRELLIDDTCFLNANECKEMGLVDKIIGEKEE